MGMNLTIYLSTIQPQSENNYLDITDVADWVKTITPDESYIVYNAPKFWELYYCMDKPNNGQYVQLKLETLKRLRDCAASNRDFFGSYSTVPILCELTDKFTELEAKGIHLWFLCEW